MPTYRKITAGRTNIFRPWQKKIWMHHLCKFFISSFILSFCFCQTSFAQVPADSTAAASDTTSPVTSLNADLLNIFNQKTPQKYKVASIKVTGNKSFDQTLLLSIADLNVGDEILIPGGDNFSKAITKLWAQNYFSDIQIYITSLQGNNINVEVAVTERPRLSNFYFKGIKKGEADDLNTKSGLVRGRVITENMKHTAVDAIKKYYAEKGFRNVSVDIDQRPDTTIQNSLALIFNIDKGTKVHVNDITFIGNAVKSSSLKQQMKGTHEMSHLTLFPSVDTGGLAKPQTTYPFNDYLRKMGYLSYTQTKEIISPYLKLNFLSSSKFDEKKYEDDKDKIVDYYNSLGYRDASIAKDTQYYNNKGNMDIDIKVDEGHKYYFGNITWRGNTKYSDSLLTAILNIKKGDTYNADALNSKLGRTQSPEGGDISGLYMDDGYLFFRADPIETAVYKDTIDFEIQIVEGPQATIKNVRISGNEKTKDYVIRRELRTIPGEKFSRTDLIRSQREIANLGFFDPEKTNPNIVPNTDDGTVDINWALQEKSSDQLELSAGFGGGIGLTGTLGITFNNFSIQQLFKKGGFKDGLPVGDGQKLSIRFQSNGSAYRSYNISFTEPWFGGKKRNSFSVSVFDTKFANAYDPLTGTYTSSAADTSYFRTTGISVGLAKQLKWPDDYFQLGFTLSYARYKLKNYYIDQVNLPGFNNGFSNNFNLKIALERSSVDQPTFPHSGSDFVGSVQVTPPYSLLDPSLVTSPNPYEWIEYHKWRFDATWYVPLTKPIGDDRKQFVLKLAAKYGFIGRYNSLLNISPFERFQVGDAGLSNSYALLGYEIISQRGYPVYQTSDPRVNPDQTGASEYFTIFNKYTMELRYPLSLSQSSTIYGLAFFEAANGWYTFKDYNPFQLRRSVGIGMRFFLPMFGLLGFDYGIGLDRYGPNSTSLKNISRFTFMLGYEPE